MSGVLRKHQIKMVGTMGTYAVHIRQAELI